MIRNLHYSPTTGCLHCFLMMGLTTANSRCSAMRYLTHCSVILRSTMIRSTRLTRCYRTTRLTNLTKMTQTIRTKTTIRWTRCCYCYQTIRSTPIHSTKKTHSTNYSGLKVTIHSTNYYSSIPMTRWTRTINYFRLTVKTHYWKNFVTTHCSAMIHSTNCSPTIRCLRTIRCCSTTMIRCSTKGWMHCLRKIPTIGSIRMTRSTSWISYFRSTNFRCCC